MKTSHIPTLILMGLGTATAGCGQQDPSIPTPTSVPVSAYHAGANSEPVLNLGTQRTYPQGSGLRQNPGQGGLADGTVDYALALRTAALKLNGRLPTMDEQAKLKAAIAKGANDGSADDPGAVYRGLIQGYIAAPAFAGQMMSFWRNQLRMGVFTISGGFQGSLAQAMARQVDLESGPALMARLTVEGKDLTTAFTQATNNCPTFTAPATFTDGNCFVAGVNLASPPAKPGSNVAEGQQAGILTNPGFMAHYYSNFAFRRARVIQEIFGCTPMPSEFTDKPEIVGPYVYASPWPRDGIPNDNKAPTLQARRYAGTAPATPNNKYVSFNIDCQTCHNTLNHRAALFAVFDAVGFSSGDMTKMMVSSPVEFVPFAQLAEYFPATDKPAWKYGQPANTFQEFGQAMAKDPDVQRCFVTRAWNHAYSRDDVVTELALVPASVSEETYQYFKGTGFNFKKMLEKIYTDPNFIRF